MAEHKSIYDAQYHDPKTVEALVKAVMRLHESHSDLRKEMDDFKRDSLPARTFRRLNRLEEDFIALKTAFDEHDTSGRHVLRAGKP